MTVQNSNVKNIYIGNGSTTSFPFTFPCPKAEYIKVFVRKNNLIAQIDDFTVDLDNSTITYPKSGTPLAAGENLVILRELPLEQPLNLVNQGPFFAEDIETTLDEGVMMNQQLREQLGRSLTVPVDIDAENAFATNVPIKPGMSFRVKDDGSGFEETEDPARVLPLATDALQKAEAARDVAIAKADAAGASAASAAESEMAADRSATQAEAAKTAAKVSETAAAKSAAAAKVSETNAKTSETNAATMEDRASASAQKAKDWATKNNGAVENGQYSAYHYATYAEGQANIATTKAGEASSSAAAAKASETAAAKSAAAAKTSEANAAKSAADAAKSAAALGDLSFIKGIASQAEAEAGTDNTKMMTPLRTKQAIEAYKTFKGATSTAGGEKGFVPAPTAKEQMSFLRGDGTWAELSTSLAPAPVTRRKIEKKENEVRLWWHDPEPIMADGKIIADWTKTVIVKKRGSYPENPDDGAIVLEVTQKNKYTKTPYVDSQVGAENWYYRAFPYNGRTYNNEVFNKFGFFSYAVYIDEEDAAEETCVHKVQGYENYHLENAAMNFVTDEFYWGGWENAQFMPKPCMLRSNGAVAYYLNPEDYTKRESGSSSDVANTAFEGNAMMEWPTIFTKIKREGSKLYLYFASEKLDPEYECYSTLLSNGSYAKNFYTPIYEGSVIQNKMRSLSTNARPTGGTTAENEAIYAMANGSGWNTTVWADEQLMQMLGVLVFGRLNIQKACGYNCGSGSGLTHNCGSGNTKGMFYGKESTGPTATKYFGMENWWGHRWRRCNGVMLVGYNFKIKMTHHTKDGSTATGYNRTGDGYIDTGLKCPGANGSYIKNVHGHKLAAFLPSVVTGASATTYFCDAAWSAGGTTMLLCGGCVAVGAVVGLFACVLDDAPSYSAWAYGASLSYHNL